MDKMDKEGNKNKKEQIKMAESDCAAYLNIENGSTHPSGFTLVLKGFLSVLRCRLYVIHGMLDVVLDTIDHFTL